ncbi:spermidine synthase [Desulfovibrio inopinatus]|uniref:spermine/spermidine synthase domain-containing protein n=1 Tax=Desulfovibrio inopinatus TaxID=102109 RepID=UPI000555A33E|nr:spermidine synthase [Desulfovibrio inopinatus]
MPLDADLWLTEYFTAYDGYTHGITDILAHRRTAFQDMMIVKTGVYGLALVLDGKWQCSQADEALYHEPLVHVPCLLHQAPRSVLILGGGDGCAAREALKWPGMETVVMVDIDGDVVAACREHLAPMHQGAFDDPRFHLVVDDAFNYLKQTDIAFDIVISDLSDPIEDGPSAHLFTQETFALCQNVLSKNGVFVIQAGTLGPSELSIHARIVNTVQHVFPHATHYASSVPTWAAPIGFALGSQQPIVWPEASVVDALLGQLRPEPVVLDSIGLLHVLHQPKHIRQAIAAETTVYTHAAPPKDFGRGLLGE